MTLASSQLARSLSPTWSRHRSAATGAAISQRGPGGPAAEALVLAVARAVRHLFGHVGVAQLATLLGTTPVA